MQKEENIYKQKSVVRTRIELVTSSVWRKRDNHYTNAPITDFGEIKL